MSEPSFVIQVPNEKPSWKDILKALPDALKFIFSIDRAFVVMLIGVQFLEVPQGIMSVLVIKYLTDALTAGDANRAWRWFFIMLITFFIGLVMEGIRGVVGDTLRYKLQISLTRRWLEHMGALSYATLENTQFQSLGQMFERKAYMFWNVGMSLMWMSGNMFASLGLLSVFLYLPWPAVLIFIGAQIVRIVLMQRSQKWSWDVIDGETREGKRVQYHQSVLTNLSTLQEAKTLGFDREFLARWKKVSDALLQARLRLTRANMWTVVTGDAVQYAGLMIGLAIILVDVLHGHRTVSVVVVFMTTLFQFQRTISSLAGNINWFSTESVFLPIFKAFFAIPEEKEQGKSLPKKPLTIEFQDVWFRYPGTEKDILQGIHLTFTQSDHIALVGLNGAGKSTFLKLLMGMYRPTRGQILVNGTPLHELKPSAWRSALSVLSQTIQRYDDSLEDQILYGDIQKKKNSERFRMALETSRVQEVADELKNGLKAHIGKQYAMEGDEPIELSGGQNQLLAIARTLYRDARIYVFDEPTSAVDAEKEEHFFASLPNALQSRALIFVSHRFSTLRRASHILVMDEGKIIEAGTHEALLAKQGRYAELFALQAKMYQ